jgi:hypothetical protein
VASIPNPILMGAFNPTGNNLALDSVLSTTSKGTNALLPNVNLSPSASSTSSNPYAFPANAGGYTSTNLAQVTPGGPTNATQSAATSPIGGMNLMTPKDISRLFDTLKKTYGDGPAHAILDFLTSGAGFNQAAINNLFAALQPGIERGEEDLMSQFSASGNRFGSGAQIGLGDYLSRVKLNEGQLETQMYEDAINKYIDTLLSTSGKSADRIAQSPSGLDSILSGIGLGGQAAGGASSIISAISPGADTGILDAIAGAAAFA